MAIHSPEFRQKRQKRRRRILVVSSVLTIVVLGSLMYLLHMERFLISDIQVEGNNVTRNEEVRSIASEVISGKYLLLFPRANAAVFPRKAISSEVRSRIPRIEDVELSLDDPRTLRIVVKERSPYALYCQEVPEPTTPEECFFLDQGGFIFSRAPFFSGIVYFIYTSTLPIGEPIGEFFLPEAEFLEVSAFVENVKEFGIRPEVLELDGENFHLRMEGGGEVVWKREDSVLVIERSLEAFLADKEVLNNKNFLQEVLYIDLRFKNKVFYKFQADAEVVATTTVEEI